ncbi:MAG: FtsX-like permease family protein [Chloroflexi bacterium]|nr:FtsX-like permease family protein [Chloroflexota bacterium]MDA1239225.1 FtsX-like permease family protein [Chloroflexota bacterium]
MDSLFGIPLTNILAVLAVMVGIAFATLGWVAFRNPLLVRMGLRNVVRRKAQTILIVIGLMLSTLIISAAFATGDTVGYSITNAVYNDLGEADVVLAFDAQNAPPGVEALTDADLAHIQEALAANPDVDGVSGLVQESVPAINQGERLSEPRAQLVGVDPATGDAFNALITPAGDLLRAADLGDGEVYITDRLASDILAGAGDEIVVVYDGVSHTLRVAGIVRDNALTARPADASGALPAGGVVGQMDLVRAITGEPDSLSLIVVSARGGVRDTLDLVGPISVQIEDAIEALALPIREVVNKEEAVAFANLIGSVFVTFFLVFGLFSIAAGVMLIFLTFIMLAAERRAEMGMARAIGMKRLHLTQSFIAEGMAYNVGSALVGALLGLGVSYMLIFVMGRVFEDFGFNITFHVNFVGFGIAYCLGVVITFLTVAISSWRAANLNIVRAIRDIDEPQPLRGDDRSIKRLLLASLAVGWFLLWFVPPLTLAPLGLSLFNAVFRRGRVRHTRRNAGGWAVWMLIIGVAGVWWGGWVAQQAFAYTAGFTLMLLSLAMLWVYFGGRARPAFTLASGLLIWYWLLPLPFSLMFEAGKGWIDPISGFFSLFGLEPPPIQGNIEMFFVSGISITASATLFVLFNADLLLKGVSALRFLFGGLMPAIRTAVAYPLASKFRTGMAIAMFGLVVFSLVVMATLNSNFTQLFLGQDATGGFQVAVKGSPNNRIPDLRVALTEAGYDVDGNITGVGTMLGGAARVISPVKDPEDLPFYRIRSIDEEFANIAAFPMLTRAAGYDSDEAVLQALLADPTVAVVDESRLTIPGSFGEPGAAFLLPQTAADLQDAPWEPIAVTVQDPVSGNTVDLKIIGILRGPVTGVIIDWAAFIVGPTVMTESFRGGEFERFFIQTADASKDGAIEASRQIESTLIERGVQATAIQEMIDDAAAASTAFQVLFEAFMGLGLVVGIAALGVIAFRTVAERRQQIGMLRAIGYSRRLIAASFFLESSFIAITGIGMGVILGGALSYNLMTSPEFTNGNEIDFAFPWMRLFIMVGIAYGASALMTLIPARSASRVVVAEALRYNG